MGLIRAGIGAVGSVMADQWKEFFYCDAMDADVLVTKGVKRTSSRSSNRGSDNIISNGSGIAVADGQCMMIVEQGKVVEVCAEPGQFTYDASTEPSIFAGKLGKSILVCVGDADNDKTMLDGADYAYCPGDAIIKDKFPNVCDCAQGAVADVIYKKIPEILGFQP